MPAVYLSYGPSCWPPPPPPPPPSRPLLLSIPPPSLFHCQTQQLRQLAPIYIRPALAPLPQHTMVMPTCTSGYYFFPAIRTSPPLMSPQGWPDYTSETPPATPKARDQEEKHNRPFPKPILKESPDASSATTPVPSESNKHVQFTDDTASGPPPGPYKYANLYKKNRRPATPLGVSNRPTQVKTQGDQGQRKAAPGPSSIRITAQVMQSQSQSQHQSSRLSQRGLQTAFAVTPDSSQTRRQSVTLASTVPVPTAACDTKPVSNSPRRRNSTAATPTTGAAASWMLKRTPGMEVDRNRARGVEEESRSDDTVAGGRTRRSVSLSARGRTK